MRAFTPLAVLLLATSVLTACGSAADNKTTETRMDDVDSVAGTISDDMINTDENTDEAPVDAPPPSDAPKDDKKPADKMQDSVAKEKAPDTSGPVPATGGDDE